VAILDAEGAYNSPSQPHRRRHQLYIVWPAPLTLHVRPGLPSPPAALLLLLLLQEAESVRRGMGVKPMGKVFYMPAASDAYVAGFRWVGVQRLGERKDAVAGKPACLLRLL
jgi:hypothetical protein